MTEYERVRESALLTDEEIKNLMPMNGYLVCDLDVAIAKAQLDKALKTDGIEIRADDQNLPEFLTLSNISREELVDATRNSMLKSDSKGRVWRKVIPKKEEKDES